MYFTFHITLLRNFIHHTADEWKKNEKLVTAAGQQPGLMIVSWVRSWLYSFGRNVGLTVVVVRHIALHLCGLSSQSISSSYSSVVAQYLRDEFLFCGRALNQLLHSLHARCIRWHCFNVSVIRPHRIHEMRGLFRSMIPTSVSQSVCHADGLCKNG